MSDEVVLCKMCGNELKSDCEKQFHLCKNCNDTLISMFSTAKGMFGL